MAAQTGETFSWRLQGAIYGTAFFTGNLFPMISVVMPLWALALGASPFVIGLIIASRQLLTITMSIHGGALLDRYGPRQVILVLGMAGACMTGLFPVLPFIWAAMLLQIATGFAEATNWIGAQAMVGQFLKGRSVYAGRMVAAARFGGFIGPPLTGFCWELYGPAGAFLFLACWVLAGSFTAWFIPKHEVARAEPGAAADAKPTAKRRASDAMPKLSDYVTTLRLLVVPAIALVILATVMRQAGSGMQTSFYPIWLTENGITPTTIGWLIGISNMVSGFAALAVGPLTRYVPEHWLLIFAVILTVAPIAATPLIGPVLALLYFAIALRGIGQGLVLPVFMSLTARAVPHELQGRVAALRITFNRFGGALVPVFMGALAETAGLAWSFYIVGIVGCLLVLGLAVWVARSPAFGGPPPDERTIRANQGDPP